VRHRRRLARAGFNFGYLPRSRPLALATFILPGAETDEIDLELGDHGQNVQQQPADRIGRVMHGTAKTELDVPLRPWST
jgi:hypothetical protein